MVKKYLNNKGVEFTEQEALGSDYETHAQDKGFNVPLIVNTQTGLKSMGWNVSELNKVIGE